MDLVGRNRSIVVNIDDRRERWMAALHRLRVHGCGMLWHGRLLRLEEEGIAIRIVDRVAVDNHRHSDRGMTLSKGRSPR